MPTTERSKVDTATVASTIVNAGLDIGYIVVGLAVAGPVANGDPFVAGNGWGIVLQGAFLLGFDAWHARRVPIAVTA